MQTVTSETDIRLSPQQAWEKLSDLSLAHNYVPGIIRTEITTDAVQGEGASRRVYQSKSRYINETVTEWRQGQGFTIRLHKDNGNAPAPFAAAEFSYDLAEIDARNTRLHMELRFRMAGGYLGEWAARTLMAGAFQSRLDAVSAGLKRFYERGAD